MRYTTTPAATLALTLALCSATLALWGRYPNDKPVKADNWPSPIVKAINAHPRVYGAGSWDMGWAFYYKGDTKALNEFLAIVAQDRETLLSVVLSPDEGKAAVMSAPLEPDLHIEFNWMIHLGPYRDGYIHLDRNPDESDAAYDKRFQAYKATLPEFAARVDVHCVGPIDPAKLQIPVRFHAAVQDRLTNLADIHNERRARAEKEGTLDRESPTPGDAQRGGGLFGATTQPIAEDDPAD